MLFSTWDMLRHKSKRATLAKHAPTASYLSGPDFAQAAVSMRALKLLPHIPWPIQPHESVLNSLNTAKSGREFNI